MYFETYGDDGDAGSKTLKSLAVGGRSGISRLRGNRPFPGLRRLRLLPFGARRPG